MPKTSNGWLSAVVQVVVLLLSLGAFYGKLSADINYLREAFRGVKMELTDLQSETRSLRIAVTRLEERTQLGR